MNKQKLLTFAGIMLLLFLLIAFPEQTAALVKNIAVFLYESAVSLVEFVQNLDFSK